MKKHLWFVLVICFCSTVSVSTFIGCKKEGFQYATTSDVNIVDYLRRYPDQFSEFVKILDRTNISPFLNAYGAYTCFAPTNNAFKLYLKKIGKASTDDLDTATLKNICSFHLIQDTLTTGSFTDGKLASPTMYGQYLITGVNNSGLTVINRQAILTQPNILTGNGYIHVIDNVLEPATITIAKMIENNSNYSIFTQILKATGFYDSLNIVKNPDTTRRFLTCFAEPDSILKKQNILSYTDMVNRFSTTGNPRNQTDSLFLYAAYHILPALKYVADIVSAQSHLNLAPQSVITVLLSGQTVLLNQVTINGVFEPGIAIDKVNSDNSCANGVLHTLTDQLLLKYRKPFRVDFDPGDQPEIRKLTSIFRKPGKSQSFTYGQLQYVNWQQTKASVTYNVEASTTSQYYWWDDGFFFNLRQNFNNWIEFTTPLIVKGDYYVWINFRKSNMGQFTNVNVDDMNSDSAVGMCDFVSSRPSGTPAVLRSQKFKVYTVNQSQKVNYGVFVGLTHIKTSDRHVIRFTCAKEQGKGSNPDVSLDFIQFIPVNDDQLRPLYARDGSLLP